MKEIQNTNKSIINPFKIKLSKSNVVRFEHAISNNIFEISNGKYELMNIN